MHAPTDFHWAAVKHILRYLKGTTSYGFHMTRGSSFALHGFTNADWAGILSFLVRRRFLGNPASNALLLAPLRRLSIKPLLMVQVIWLQYLLTDLQVPSVSAPTIWCDNLGATYLSANPIFHARTKHVEVDYHFVHDRVAKKEIQIHFVPSRDQLTDVFTKPLPVASFTAFRFKLRVDPPPSAWGGILKNVYHVSIRIGN